MDGNFLNKKAFSLTEIAVSLSVIMAILLALLPLGGQMVSGVKGIKTQNDLNFVGQACQQYYRSMGHWPSQLSDLQPSFLNSNINGSNYIFNPQANILTITSGGVSTTVVKPGGLMRGWDY